MPYASFRQFFDAERLIHSFKTLIACALALLLTHLLQFKTGQWMVITILVVMCSQMYVGSVLQKSWYRFLGTLIGCLLCAITITLLGVSALVVALTIGITSFIFSYAATSRENMAYAGTLGAVTTAIVLLGQNPSLSTALERFLEITLGILIAALVSQFILPIHARTHLRRAQASTLAQLRSYYETVLVKPDKDLDYHDLDEAIVKSLLTQRRLAIESKRELLGIAFSPSHFLRVLYAEREILRAITYMHTALVLSKSAISIQTSPDYAEFNNSIMAALSTLSQAMENGTGQKPQIHIPPLQALKTIIQNSKGTYSEQDMLYMNSFLFSTEILIKNIMIIADLVEI